MERRAPAEHKRSGKEKAQKDVAETVAVDGNGDEGEDEVAAREEEDDIAGKERRVLKFWLPPIEGSAVLAMALAFAWQKAVRLWPEVMVHFMLWSTFSFTMAAGILLLYFSLTPTIGLGIALIGFSIGTELYACWVNRRTDSPSGSSTCPSSPWPNSWASTAWPTSCSPSASSGCPSGASPSSARSTSTTLPSPSSLWSSAWPGPPR